MLRILAAFTLLMAVFTASGEISHACGCADHQPMPETQLNALKERASGGDVTATGDVWFEYDGREDDRLSRIWRFRAIRAGDPRVASRRADHWLSYARRTANPAHKRIFVDAAVALLENGYRNRDLIDRDLSSSADYQYNYLSQLREARAAQRVLRDGIAFWEVRGRRGDADGAFHAAVFHFRVNGDQRKRSVWEMRASALGDPGFAGQAVGSYDRALSLRHIRAALVPNAPVHAIRDPWEKAVMLRELRDRLRRELRRQALG